METEKNENESESKVVEKDMKFSLTASCNLASFGIPLEISGSGSYGLKDTLNSARTSSVKQLNKALDKQTNKASSLRSMEVKTESETVTTTTEENTVVREIQNTNLSRTLNFAFRQLLQEFLCFTVLQDVRIVFSNGDPNFTQTARLSDLDSFLDRIMVDAPTAENTKK